MLVSWLICFVHIVDFVTWLDIRDVTGTYPVSQSFRLHEFREARNGTEETFGYSAFQQWGQCQSLWPKPAAVHSSSFHRVSPPKPPKENSLLNQFLGLRCTNQGYGWKSTLKKLENLRLLTRNECKREKAEAQGEIGWG